MSKLTAFALLVLWCGTVVRAQSSLSCDKSSEHATLLASCGRMALVWNESNDRFDSLADSLGAECDDASATQYCSRLRAATGKAFVKGVVDRTGTLMPPVPSQVWLWACTDAARSFNCTQVKGSFIDCWFSASDPAPKLPFGTCSRPKTASAGVFFQASLPNTPPNTPASYQSPCKQSMQGHYCAGPDTLVFCTRATPSIFYNCPCLVQPGGTADKCDVTPSATSAPAATPTMAVPTTTTTTTTKTATTTSTATQASSLSMSLTLPVSLSTSTAFSTTLPPMITTTAFAFDAVESDDGALVGGIVGGVVAVVLLLAVVAGLLLWRLKRAGKPESSDVALKSLHSARR
jgi:hypothetical protein